MQKLKNVVILLFIVLCVMKANCQQYLITRTYGKWSEERARVWGTKHGWLRGANYIPHTAVNQLEMWQEATFDTTSIKNELYYARNTLGYNFMRVFLHSTAWRVDKEGFKKRMKKYLDIAGSNGIYTMFVFFDDCWSWTNSPGTQPEPIVGIHNSRWLGDPGKPEQLQDFPYLEEYMKDILTCFATDDRIYMWDVYNEPGCNGHATGSTSLLRLAFKWAREVFITQPISSGWGGGIDGLGEMPYVLMNNADIINFHDYQHFSETQFVQRIEFVKTLITEGSGSNRPVLYSEWLARTGSAIDPWFGYCEKYGVNSQHWGLFKGKTNTIYAWGDRSFAEPNTPNYGREPDTWFHDIVRPDYTPFSQTEVNYIKSKTQSYSNYYTASANSYTGFDSAAIQTWSNQQGWLRGCNFIPSTAINSIAMWRNASFDITTIQREITLARGLGYNVLGVNLSFNVWRDEQSSFYNNVSVFLETARLAGLKVIFVLFDDTGQPVTSTLNSYTNPEPTPGVYRSNWSSSPINPDPNIITYDSLHKSYVQGILQRFYNNSTIVMWDMYNEPKPSSLNLLTNAFNWARATSDRHPLTTALYTGDTTDEGLSNNMSYWQAKFSDVLTFKFKGENSRWTSVIQTIQSSYNSNNARPLMCLEYLARTNGNNFNTILNYGKQNNIGVLNGGLVSGKTNGIYTPGVTQPQPPQLWYQDLYNPNGIPYSQAEILYIRSVCILNYCP